MYVSFYDIGITIIFLIIVILGVYLINAIRKTIFILDGVKRVLDTNETNIQETISVLPALLGNANQIAASIKDTASQANNVIDDVRTEWETLLIYVKAVGELVKIIFFKSK